MPSHLPTTIIVASFFSAYVSAQMPSVSFTPSPSAAGAAGISQVLSPSFAGMGIEPSNLYSFTGFEEVNQLTINCLNTLANYTGVPPYIRLGGNTQDYMIWMDDYTDYGLLPNPSPTGQGAFASDSLIFGPRYFEAFDRFPTGTPLTFGLNLAYSGTAYGGYLENIATEAQAALTHLNNTHLQAFEIGNEPDLYNQNGFRTGDWSGTVYGQEWAERAEQVWTKVLQPAGLQSNYFEPGTTASTIGTSFEISMLAASDISKPAPGSSMGYINAWSQHDYFYYISVSTYALTLDIMMDLSNTISQFGSWVQQVGEAQATKIPYVLREMASVGPVGLIDISDTFGATLFTFNFFLYTAGLGISSVEFHMTDTSFASPWQPIAMDIFNTPPHVRSSYAAWTAMAQIVGPSCTTQIGGLNIDTYPANYDGRLAAYTGYQSGKLTQLIMINTQPSNMTVTNKGSADFTFNLPHLAGQIFYLSYLTAPGSDAKLGTTWNGYSYQTPTGTPMVINSKVDSMKVPSNGRLTVAVRDSSAIVANLGAQLGTGHDTKNSNCANLAREAAAVQGESQQQQHPISVATASNAATPTGYNNYNANGAASGARPTPAGDGGSGSGSSSSGVSLQGSATLVASIAVLIAGAALLL